MSVTSPSTEARLALKGLVAIEFAPEAFAIKDGYIHQSVGMNGVRIGISPVSEAPYSRDNYVLVLSMLVQFYGRWRDEPISPENSVDPVTIETYAERFRRSLKGNDPLQTNAWYFLLEALNYPLDPVGQKTRFEATVRCYANNAQLIETTG